MVKPTVASAKKPPTQAMLPPVESPSGTEKSATSAPASTTAPATIQGARRPKRERVRSLR